MNDRKVITEMKQEDYKFWFDAFNIFILFLSALLTVIEAIKNDVDVERVDEPTKQFFKISPLFISTTIGFITAIVKFKRFQERLEMNTKAIEKSIFTTYRMKKLQEDIHLADDDAFIKLLEIYKEEIFPLYNQAQGEIEGTLQFRDIIKYSAIKKKMENSGNLTLLKLKNDEIKHSRRINNELNQEFNGVNSLIGKSTDSGINDNERIFNRPPTPYFLEEQDTITSLTGATITQNDQSKTSAI